MVKQISIIGNMKKNYVQPNSEVVLVNMENCLLEYSINDEKSGFDDLAKDDIFDTDKNYTW